jgi:hypothetical protein
MPRKRAKLKVLPGIEPGSPGCPTSQDMMSIRTGSDNRYTIEPKVVAELVLLDGDLTRLPEDNPSFQQPGMSFRT